MRPEERSAEAALARGIEAYQRRHFDEAVEQFGKAVEIDPNSVEANLALGNHYANYQIGLIPSARAHRLMPNYGRLPAMPEPDLSSLRAKAGPLLEEALFYLDRALALSGDRTAAAHLLEDVTSMQTYLVDPERSARELRERTTELFRKHVEARLTSGTTEADDTSSVSVTFHLTPEAIAEDQARPFPPNPWRIPIR